MSVGVGLGVGVALGVASMLGVAVTTGVGSGVGSGVTGGTTTGESSAVGEGVGVGVASGGVVGTGVAREACPAPAGATETPERCTGTRRATEGDSGRNGVAVSEATTPTDITGAVAYVGSPRTPVTCCGSGVDTDDAATLGADGVPSPHVADSAASTAVGHSRRPATTRRSHGAR
jgi:hypothetical protein